MTSSTGIGPTNPEAEAQVRFAAFVADLRAHAHDPTEEGDECRELLAEDPQNLRALFDVADAHGASAAYAGPFGAPLLMLTLVLTIGCVAAVGATMLVRNVL